MLTQNEILTIVRNVILTTPIQALNGQVYKKVRPTDSVLEDCVINIISGVSGKFLQDGALYVKIYYKDLYNSNTYWEDTAVGEIKEKLLHNLSELFFTLPQLSFNKDSREFAIEAVPEKHEHFVVLKINFLTVYN